MNKKILFLSIVLLMSFSFARWDDEPEYNELDFECDLDDSGEYDCDDFYKFGNRNWQDKDYRGCIDQFKLLIKCGCRSQQDLGVYQKLSSSFVKLKKPIYLDSAAYYIDNGLQDNPDDVGLLELGGWVAGKQHELGGKDKLNDQITYYDSILEIDPNNFSILERLSNIYKDNNRYEEQVVVLDRWLEIDPTNTRAISDKKEAFSKLGRDESEVDKERWENEQTNLVYGVDYINSLLNQDEPDIELAIEVGDILYQMHSKEKELLRLISDIYIEDFNDDAAIPYLIELAEIDNGNIDVMIDLSNAYLNISEYEDAYYWADIGVDLNKKIGDALFQRAQVLIATVEEFESLDIDFCDRVVYDLALLDFMESYESGNMKAKIYEENLDEYITKSEHWFLSDWKKPQLSPSNTYCKQKKNSDCYNWITRSVKRKG